MKETDEERRKNEEETEEVTRIGQYVEDRIEITKNKIPITGDSGGGSSGILETVDYYERDSGSSSALTKKTKQLDCIVSVSGVLINAGINRYQTEMFSVKIPNK